MSKREPCWDLTTWEGLRDLVLARSRLAYPGERSVARIAIHCLWHLRHCRREVESLRAEVKRLGERCAICKHLWQDNTGPGCIVKARVPVFGMAEFSFVAPVSADGLCDIGKFKRRGVEHGSDA